VKDFIDSEWLLDRTDDGCAHAIYRTARSRRADIGPP
jgi:hypothetical protein